MDRPGHRPEDETVHVALRIQYAATLKRNGPRRNSVARQTRASEIAGLSTVAPDREEARLRQAYGLRGPNPHVSA